LIGFGHRLMALESVRIALKPMTRMSLNERFQLLRQTQLQRRQTNAFNGNKMAQNVSRLELRQGSQKNRRLALQMANRPSVLAALRAQNNQNIPQKTRSVKQRLGVRRAANQSIPSNPNRYQNRNRFKLNRSFNANNTLNRNRNANNSRNNNSIRVNANNRRNNTQNIGVIVGVRPKGLRLRRNLKSAPNAAVIKGKRRVGQPIRNQNQAKGVVRKRFQLNRNFNPRNNQSKPQKRQNVKPNKEQLDKDLDAYMAGTKSYLDAELDAYMSQTN